MIAAILLASFMVALVILYLRRPYFRPFQVSFARFFDETMRSPAPSKIFSLQSLRTSRPFYPQFAVLFLLLVAILAEQTLTQSKPISKLGVWVFVDTSASMSTFQEGSPRIIQARQVVENLLTQLKTFEPATSNCLVYSSFNMELKTENISADDLSRQLDTLTVQPLGTDVHLVEDALAGLNDQQNSLCKITHALVVTDLPVPDDLPAPDNLPVIWIDVGRPVDNAGIVDIRRDGNPALSVHNRIIVDVRSYTPGTLPITLRVLDPQNREICCTGEVNWYTVGRQQRFFDATLPGDYKIGVFPVDAYLFDNVATIHVDDTSAVKVDWELPDNPLVDHLGWVSDKVHPDIRVLAFPSQIPTDNVPTLLVGDAYMHADKQSEIADFVETSPLLDNLNFDVAESLKIGGVEPTALLPLDSVLADDNNNVWIAQRLDPAAAYIPGLPTGTGQLYNFSTTLFFNAIRWLLANRVPPPLYTLTAPNALDITGNRNVLFPDEADTGRVPKSKGMLSDIQPAAQTTSRDPIFPLVLLIVLLIVLFERYKALWGGVRWT